MAVAYLVAAHLLVRGRMAAVPIGIAAGSAMVFLGLMDTLYNLEHGQYAIRTPEMVTETAINVVCLVFGPWTMVACGARDGRRLADRPPALRRGLTARSARHPPRSSDRRSGPPSCQVAARYPKGSALYPAWAMPCSHSR